jgi:two-component system cell cycle response regulator DivK
MPSGRILYVEDNFDNRILIKRVLEAEGYTVVEAENGLQGVALARTARPDLVLMDINLPDIDGYECTNRLRQIETMRGVPVLALTANVLEGEQQKALGAGCDGYISKPIDVDELPRQIEAHLKKSNGSQKKQPEKPQRTLRRLPLTRFGARDD